MGYQFSSENFEKIVYESIRKNKNQMDFLRDKCSQILLEEKTFKEKLYCFSQFIYQWFLQIRCSMVISSTDSTLNSETTSIFYDLLDEIFELVSFEDFAYEIIQQINEDI